MLRAAAPVWREGAIRAAGARLATFETGSTAPGARAVVLLHGLGQWSDAAWGALLPRLDPSLRYLAFDLPGFGASERPDAPYDRPYFRGALDEVVTAAGLERFSLVGHSLGGLIAADYAGIHPDRIDRLALIAPAGFTATPRHLVYGLASGVARWAFNRPPSRGFVEGALRRSVVDPAVLDQAMIDQTYELSQDPLLRRAFAGVYSGVIQTFAHRRRLHASFARYQGPVFCAWGRHDRYLPMLTLRRVAQVYPAVQTLVLERSGHLAMLDEPAILGPALAAFLG